MNRQSVDHHRPLQFSVGSLLLLVSVFAVICALARSGLIHYVQDSVSNAEGMIVGLLCMVVGFAVGQVIATVPGARATMMLVSLGMVLLTLGGKLNNHGDDLWFFFCAACGTCCACLASLWRESRRRRIDWSDCGPKIRRADGPQGFSTPKLTHHGSNRDNDRLR